MTKVIIFSDNSENISSALTALGILPVDKAALSETDFMEISAVYFTGSALTADRDAVFTAIERAHECGAAVVFDPDVRGIPEGRLDAELINSAAAASDVFIPNLREAQLLCGAATPVDIAEHYLALGTKKVVVTLGKQGAFFKSRVESGIAPTFRAENIVDTVGAGDCFAAGLISGICEEIPLSEAVVRANAAGSMQIQSSSESFPTMAQLREYMLSHRFVVEGCKEV